MTADEGLRRQVSAGLSWSFASNVLSRLGTFVTGLVLARLLIPAEYGEFTVALVAMTLLVNFNDLGLEQTLVRWPRSIDRIAPTATTVIFASSVLLYAACYLGAPAFAGAMGAPEATGIVRVLAIGVVINGVFAVPSATLTREFRQDRRTVADLTGFFLGTVLMIGLALAGLGAWAMVWGRLVGNAAVSVGHALLAPRRYRPGWDRAVAAELLRAGLPLAGATVVAVALLNLDYVVVGRLLGTQQLGYYTQAFNLASWPVTFFAVAVARVAVPAFGRLQEEPVRLQRAFDRSSVLLATATVPTCLLLAVFADPLVRFLYGDVWAPAAPVLRWLAALGLLRVLYQFWADLLTGVGAGRRVLTTQLVWLVALLACLLVGARFGLVGVGAGHVVAALVVVGPVYLLALRGIVSLRESRRTWGLLGLAAVLAGAAGVAVTRTGWPHPVVLAVGTTAVLAVYLTTVHLTLRSHGVDLRAAWDGLRRVVHRPSRRTT